MKTIERARPPPPHPSETSWGCEPQPLPRSWGQALDPISENTLLGVQKIGHLADVFARIHHAYFPQGATPKGKGEENAGSNNRRGPLPPLPLLRGARARALRPRLGALSFLRGSPQRRAPRDASADHRAAPRRWPARLRVWAPGDAAPTRRGVQVSGVRLRSHPRSTLVMTEEDLRR